MKKDNQFKKKIKLKYNKQQNLQKILLIKQNKKEKISQK